ncbi:MAG: hypothetical protein OXN21_02180 [Chloroflexota bacterium]|nr:hypothetical protein [Chloroflexota bacterium]MYC35355.1 hypothetical protein [Chloroflexota bacterium]
MPRQRIHHSRATQDYPDDFSRRLVRFKEAADLSWAELYRRLGVDPETPRRWRDKGVLPTGKHLTALLALADSFGLGHLFRE